MVQGGTALLRQWLIASYDDLRRRLSRRLGSEDVATEALHEVWLRLDQASVVGAVEQPQSYLYRMALNASADRRRADIRWLSRNQIAAFLRSESDAIDPEHAFAVKSEFVALERALAELPARSRAVFLAALYEELSYREIAKRFGMSVRSVERDMNRAFDHCTKRLGKHKEGRRAAAPAELLEASRSVGHVLDADDDE